MKLKRILSGIISTVMTVSAIPVVSVDAEDNLQSYPYTMFASSYSDGAITVNSDNFCVNGNVATNGTIISSGNINVNGTKTENTDESMIFIFDKIDNQYFSASDIDGHTEDYTLDELNININVPIEVQGEVTLTGNINISNALKALKDVNLYGEVKNTNDSVIFSKYGDIVIDSQNVNLNGLVYAPFGCVNITAQNLNLNNVVIIADSIVITCPSLNANYSGNVGNFVGSESECLNIPCEEWQYMDDSDRNGLPDFLDDFDNWHRMKDSDADGLPDCIEQFIGTDILDIDTDKDGIDDYYELMVLFTSPTKFDSDDNGIVDGTEDFDHDGLVNYDEYIFNTYPWESDSDSDELSDGEEVNIYNTNPLKADTDSDKLVDGDEVQIGTDPNKPDTDENGILDGDERIEQTIEQIIHTDDNKVSAVNKVSVTLDCSGIIDKNVTITNMYDIDVLSSGVAGIVGVPVNIESANEFEYATITFFYDESLLNTDEDNLAILWYDEKNSHYQLLEDAVLDTENNTISYKTQHFSTYLVIDKRIWYDSWRKEMDYLTNKSFGMNYDIGFVVDVSGSMAGERLKNTKTALNNFIDSMCSDDKAFIIGFTDSATVVKEYGFPANELKKAVDSLKAGGSTNSNSGLKAGIDMLIPHISSNRNPIIILICDGSVAYNKKTEQLIEKANMHKIAVYTINICDSDSESLSKISSLTGGRSFTAKTSDDIVNTMSNLKNNVVSSIDTTDSDGDGLYDVYEIKGMRIPNGQIICTDPYKADTDGDGVTDFDELCGYADNTLNQLFERENEYAVFSFRSNPLEPDTDFDGYSDDIDPEPNKYTVVTDFGSERYIMEKQYLCNYFRGKFGVSLEINNLTNEIKNRNAVFGVINNMMNEVNSCPYLDLAKNNMNNGRDNWVEFCKYFNQNIQEYGTVTEELHYFRLKLNRTPKNFQELINNKSEWILYSKSKTRYHMNNTEEIVEFISTNPDEYPNYSTHNNEYNLKFVDINGLNEVIVAPKQNVIQFDNSNSTYDLLTNPDNWVILTSDKADYHDYDFYNENSNNYALRYDPVNVGTYNYCSYDKNIPNHDNENDKELHQKFDIDTYFKWGNVKGLFYGNSTDERDSNERYYNKNANESIYSYWKIRFN